MVNNKRRSCDVCYKRKVRPGFSRRPATNWTIHPRMHIFVRQDPGGSAITQAAQRMGLDAPLTGTTCDWCAHHDLTCTFTPRKPRARTTKTTSPTSAGARADSSISGSGTVFVLQSPPNTSAGSTPHSTSAASSHSETGRRPTRSNKCSVCQARPSPIHSLISGKSMLQDHDIYPGQNSGFVCLLTGIPHFSDGCEEWVQMRSGLAPQFDFPSFQQCTLDSMSPLAASKTKLPPRWAFDALLDAFLKSDLVLIFPLVDEVLIEETANLVYDTEGTPSLQHISAKACILALLTMVASAAMYNALACRAVFALRGHYRLFPNPKGRVLSIEEREDRHIRLLFWMCYYFDKDISLRTGHAPALDDEFCDLTLPEGYNEARWCSRSRDPSNNTQDPFFPGDMELTKVKSKVICSLYGNRAWKKSVAELIRTIRELDAELENWRSSIPREFAPQLSVRKDTRLASDLSRCMSMLHVELHLEYHHVLMVIHGASGLSAVGNAPTGNILPGVQSSSELSVEASRSTLVYLLASANRIASEAFWAFIFYPMSALMTLFFSILRQPRGEFVLKDLELIRTAAVIVRTMPIHITVPFATEYLRRVDVFVEELHRLAKGAIQKAAREQYSKASQMQLC
ncbi:hypothetical protein PWT90_07526 [Aphanocladium album]|nr:hypothetical protein PWT90_07526 [Aphanocladium album]